MDRAAAGAESQASRQIRRLLRQMRRTACWWKAWGWLTSRGTSQTRLVAAGWTRWTRASLCDLIEGAINDGPADMSDQRATVIRGATADGDGRSGSDRGTRLHLRRCRDRRSP